MSDERAKVNPNPAARRNRHLRPAGTSPDGCRE